VPRRIRASRVDGTLAAMGLADAAPRMVATFSGGMVRRLELAQALVNAPRLLVLDEPTVGLDPIVRADVWEYIAGLRESSQMTVLMTTHHMDEADKHCDRVALMHRGAIRAVGSPADLKATVGPGASLDDVFRHYTGDTLDESQEGSIRDIRRARRAARRLG
jgi:ABC-2 type transport system ATP-binding protein